MNEKRYKHVKYGSINVYYVPHLDGGGTSYGQDFIPIVRKNFKNLKRICEFGSGPGFIGFSLLGNGLCKSLCLIDINKEAIDACNYTIKANSLQDMVKVYHSDGLRKIPRSEKWDLVVSNPPHLEGTGNEYGMDLIAIDPKWRIHKEFYKNVSKFLKPKGSIIFVENGADSNPEQWFKMIRESGLRPVKSFIYKKVKRSNNQILILFIERFVEGLRDGTAFSKGIKFYTHNLKKFVKGTYKQNNFYFVWSKKIN